MKTKSKSTQVFELRLWSKEYYENKNEGVNYMTGKRNKNIYDGFIVDAKTKQKIFIDSPGDLLKAVEKLYKKAESKEKK